MLKKYQYQRKISIVNCLLQNAASGSGSGSRIRIPNVLKLLNTDPDPSILNMDLQHLYEGNKKGIAKISSVVVLEHYKPIRVRLFGVMLIDCRESIFQQKFITNDSLFTLCRGYVACGE
jgi:hypothetical protein